MHNHTTPSTTLRDIERAVGARFNLRPGALHDRSKAADIARPRQIAMYLGYELTRCSNPQIARYFGKRDHTTVISARARIKALQADPEFAGVVESCRAIVAATSPWKEAAARSVASEGLASEAFRVAAE